MDFLLGAVVVGVGFFLLGIRYLKRHRNCSDSTILDHRACLDSILFQCNDCVFLIDRHGSVAFANRRASDLFKLSDTKSASSITVYHKDKEFTLQEMTKEVCENTAFCFNDTIDIVVDLPGDSKKKGTLVLSDIAEKCHGDLRYACILSLPSQNKGLQEAFRTHPLTKLPNQFVLEHDLAKALARRYRHGGKCALMMLSIDNLMVLRSIIAHEQTNRVITRVAEFLDALSQNSSTAIKIYHLLENNFAVIVENCSDTEDVILLAKTIQEKIKSFFKLDSVRLYLTVSVGIAFQDDGKMNASALIDNAYGVLAQAQKEGEGRIVVYRQDSKDAMYDSFLLFSQMHEALEKKQFEVHYQPIADAQTGKIVSAEALIRWNHPDFGLIPPNVFIPIMEKTGFIVEVGRYVIEESLKQIKRWEMFHFRVVPVSVNISLNELESDRFIAYVKDKLHHFRIDPSLLKLEVTETQAMQHVEEIEHKLLALRRMGIGISLDDFGSGYTSFLHLRDFPADTMKIDKSLLQNIAHDIEGENIVRAMIDLGHRLGLKVVVEGVGDKDMMQKVQGFGCDMIQGYAIAGAVPSFEFQKFLREGE